MSYKVKSYAISGTGEKNGVVPGVYEECATFAEGNVVTISRGKLIIAGFEITVDGREVLSVPHEWQSGEYYLIGSLAIKDEKVESFVFSIRDNKKVRKDSVRGEGRGVYEEIIAKVYKNDNLIGVSREIPLLLGNTEDKVVPANFPRKTISGQNIALEDAQYGKLTNVYLKGVCSNRGNGQIWRVPAEFTIFSGTPNLFDAQEYTVVTDKDKKVGKYVYAEKVSLAEKDDKDFRFISWKESGSEYNSNGYVDFHIGELKASYYTFSFTLTSPHPWADGNPTNSVKIRVVQDGITLETFDYTLEKSQVNEISICSTFTTPGDVVLRIFFNGLELTLRNLQVENDLMKSTYSPYGRYENDIVIVDKKGEKYELMSTPKVQDEVRKINGKYYLIKKTAESYEDVSDAKKYTQYWINTTRTAQSVDGTGVISVPEGAFVVYELDEYKVIELNEDYLVGLENIRTYFGRTIIKGGELIGPSICGEYAVDLIKRLDLLEEYVSILMKNQSTT